MPESGRLRSTITGCRLCTSASLLLALLTTLTACTEPPEPDARPWAGVRLVKDTTGECPECCRLLFPDTFGERKDEYDWLMKLVRADIPVLADGNCRVPPTYAATNQLVRLAVKHQNARAAETLLSPQAAKQLRLDGESAEIFTLERERPLLIGYRQAAELVAKHPGYQAALVDDLVSNLCMEWGYLEFQTEREQLPAALRKNGLPEMAAQFGQKCSESIKNNVDIQQLQKQAQE